MPERSEQTQGTRAALLTKPAVSYDPLRVRNVVEVLGAKPERGNKRIRAVAYAARNHPLSPWKMARNGQPMFLVETIDTGLHPRTRHVHTGTAKRHDNRPERDFEHPIWRSVVKRRKRAKEIAQLRLDELLDLHTEVSFDSLPLPHIQPGMKLTVDSPHLDGKVTFRYKRGSIGLTSDGVQSVGFNKIAVSSKVGHVRSFGGQQERSRKRLMRKGQRQDRRHKHRSHK